MKTIAYSAILILLFNLGFAGGIDYYAFIREMNPYLSDQECKRIRQILFQDNDEIECVNRLSEKNSDITQYASAIYEYLKNNKSWFLSMLLFGAQIITCELIDNRKIHILIEALKIQTGTTVLLSDLRL